MAKTKTKKPKTKKNKFLVYWEGDDIQEFSTIGEAQKFIQKDLIEGGDCDNISTIRVYQVQRVGRPSNEIHWEI